MKERPIRWREYLSGAWSCCYDIAKNPQGHGFDWVVNTKRDRMGVEHWDYVTYICFAGTKNMFAWGPCGGNMDFFPLEDHGAHNGFADSADEFDMHLRSSMRAIKERARVVVAGMSRGGPMAMHAALQLREYGIPRNQILCMTFGSPPPGTQEFADHWRDHGCELIRLRAGDDGVPLVGLRTMGAVHPVPQTTLAVPPWTRWLPKPIRRMVHHDYSTYSYGVTVELSEALR